MLLGLFTALALAPVYWLTIPARWRRAAVAAGSVLGLTLYDARLLPCLLVSTVALLALMRLAGRARSPWRPLVTAAGLLALAAFFVWNKRAGGALATLPSQSGLALLGVSYLVLKAAAALIEAARGGFRDVCYLDVLGWIAFYPTYASGPMEELDHFRRQTPVFDRARVLGGLDRILVGLVKALLGAHYLGVWSSPVLAAPDQQPAWMLLLAAYAVSVRVYLDFSGYSDIAIGLGALYGYDIEENFDRPFLRRNLGELWRHWHMTLTRWLRLYLFIPVSRRLMRLGADRAAIAAAQIVAMSFCGLWHGLSWSFLLWGFLQALGLIWVSVVARDLGRLLPAPLVSWWRTSPVAAVVSTIITFNVFSVLMIFLVTDVPGAMAYFRRLVGV